MLLWGVTGQSGKFKQQGWQPIMCMSFLFFLKDCHMATRFPKADFLQNFPKPYSNNDPLDLYDCRRNKY